ncbi:hypothetical protein KAR91_50100 [Candidatus Pacearchaeota archaeon]|nr:hypothetical protein [Candidatus Pacearchaeota archaeon]
MNLLVAQTAKASGDLPGSLDTWGRAAQEYGLGVVLAGFVAAVLFFLIRNMIKSHNSNMINMMGLIQTRDTTLDNHLDHVTAALDNLTKATAVSTESQKASVEKLISAQQAEHQEHRNLIDRLVTEQRHSTEMVKEIIESRIDKLSEEGK